MAMATKAQTQSPTLLLLLSIFTVILLFPETVPAVSTGSPSQPNDNATNFIRTSCGTTLYPELCYTSLSRYASAVQESASQLTRFSIRVSLSKARRAVAQLSALRSGAKSGPEADPRTAGALRDCASTFGDAIDLMRRSLTELQLIKTGDAFRWQMGNVKTWMSAALTNEGTCTDGFDEIPSESVNSDVLKRLANVKEVTSNALALVNSFASQGEN